MFRPALGVTTLLGLAAGAAVTLSSCSESARPTPDAPEDTPIASSPAADAALEAIRTRMPAALDAAGLTALTATAEGALRAEATAAGPSVELPAEASGSVRVRDGASGVAVGFALEGARAVPVAVSSGFAIYPQAAPSRGDVVHRVTAAGTEDFVFYASAPAREELRYRVDASEAPGLRLVERTLEFLDASGTPRLRVAPPSLVDAAGRALPADLALEGCAADRKAAAPWGRAITRPGASTCHVVVSWAGRGVRYPAMIDPAWVSTKVMTVERSHHAIAPLPNPATPPADTSPWLITGGFDKNDQPLSSAELYEPLSRTFAATGSMIKPRAAHTSTALSTSPVGHVVIAGGAASIVDKNPPTRLAFGSLADGASTETYNPAAGTFTAGPNMSAPRFRHIAAALADGRVLFAGGITDLVNQPTKSADLFTFDGALFTGSVAPTGQLVAARAAHAASRLASGDVLVTGGVGTASSALFSGEVYGVTGGAFTTATGLMTAARAFHTQVTLSNNEVLIAGGVNSVSDPISYHNSADRWLNGAFALSAVAMTSKRAFHTATVLSPLSLMPPSDEAAEVILAGGFDGSADVASAEAYVPAGTKMLALGAAMASSRRHATAALVNAGAVNAGALVGRGVVVMGGISGSVTVTGSIVNGQATRTAEVLLKNLGEHCQAAGECLSGHCADGVCCDVACTAECVACTNTLKGTGADGTCGPKQAGFKLPVFCYDDSGSQDHVEVHNECDGAGKAQPGPDTHSCKPATCGTNGLCSTGCNTTADCAVTGWCDTTIPGGGGTAGTCQDKKAPGADCGQGDECKSAHCVDKVCCENACSGQCQACNLAGLAGQCQPVGSVEDHGQPHPNAMGVSPRTLCEGQGTACMGFCGASDLTSCTYPDNASVLHADDCVDSDTGPSTLTRYPCDAMGGSTTKGGDCGGFRCADAHACKTGCSVDDDCIQDFVCVEGTGGVSSCEALTGPLCDGKKTLRKPVAQGGDTVCENHYACPAGAIACLTGCTSVSDCVDGLVCNGKHECVETLEAPALPSCAMAPAPGRRGGVPLAAIAALFGLAAFAARRRR